MGERKGCGCACVRKERVSERACARACENAPLNYDLLSVSLSLRRPRVSSSSRNLVAWRRRAAVRRRRLQVTQMDVNIYDNPDWEALPETYAGKILCCVIGVWELGLLAMISQYGRHSPCPRLVLRSVARESRCRRRHASEDSTCERGVARSRARRGAPRPALRALERYA